LAERLHIGGHKAALANPNVGEEAKEHSKQVLEEMGVKTE
jgi:antitoxin component of RelBE/YafQ-DinJ toxin-antitoxin module